MRNPIAEFMVGFFAPWVGMKMIARSKKYFLLSIVPFFIGIVFIFLGFLAASEYITPLLNSWFNFNESQPEPLLWLKILTQILIFVSWLIVGLFNFFFGYLCILVFASPFYALLVEAILKNENKNQLPSISIVMSLKMIFIGLSKVVIFSIVGLVCFILSFVPVVNFFVPIIIYLIIAFDCMDYAFEVETLLLKQRFHFFLNNLFFFLGLGFAIFLTSLVPGAFFVVLPIFICGATKMYVQLSLKPL